MEHLPNGGMLYITDDDAPSPYVAKGGEVVTVIRADGLGDDMVRLMAGDRVIISAPR